MKRIFTIIFVLFIAVGVSNAQGISIGATGGLTLVTGPDYFTKDISEGGAGFSSAPHFGIKGRLSLPLIPLSLTGQVLYTSFSAEGEYQPGPFANPVNVETSSSLLVFGVGAEYSFVPGPISPYIGLDLFYSKLGDIDYSTSQLNLGSEGSSRTGIGVGAGIQIGIIPLIDLDVSAKYNINNLIGKEDGEDTFSTVNLSASVFFGF